MSRAHTRINLNATGFGTIHLDGQDIANHVRGLTIRSHPGAITELHLDVMTGLEYEGEVHVAMAPDVHALLVQHGWTPPGQYQTEQP